MTRPERHRHHASAPRRRLRGPITAALLAATGLLAAAFVMGWQLAGTAEQPSAPRFTGTVTEFADDGSLMCVRPDPRSDESAEFCDAYYVPPESADISVGDHVMVSGVHARTADGELAAGMLVTRLSSQPAAEPGSS